MRAARRGRWTRNAAWSLSMLLAFGALGLFAMLPHARARRADRAAHCAACRRRHVWQEVLVGLLALTILGGAAVRLAQASALPRRCEAAWAGSHSERPGPPEVPLSSPSTWHLVRGVVTAPESGVAIAYARTRGMTLCDVGDRRMTVAFLPGANMPGGSTVGDVFVTKVRWDLTERQARALARHESRHVNQWTVLSLAGGPLALPTLYGVDETFFPKSRNHFERLAGLSGGGYPEPASFGPAPSWPGVGVLAALALLLGWRRLRLLSRRLVDGDRCEEGRCELHTRGWFTGRIPPPQPRELELAQGAAGRDR